MVGDQQMRSLISSVLPMIYPWRLADNIVFKSRYNMCLIVYWSITSILIYHILQNGTCLINYIFDIFVLIVCFVYLNYLLYILTTILFVVLNILYFDRTDVTTNTFAQNWFYFPQNFKSFGFPIFRFWAYTMKVIPEARRTH
jgi:hypothetical protein